MQLYLLAPALAYSVHRFNKKALLGLFASVLGCMGWTVAVHVNNNLTKLMVNEKFEMAHVPTHLRFSSWMIGFMAGYIFIEYPEDSIQIPKKWNLFAWTLTVAGLLAVIFLNYPLEQIDSQNSPFEYGLYDAVSRVVWSIALCYIIFACAHNSGGRVDWFLSHRYLKPFARLSYAIYSIHYSVTMITMGSIETPLNADEVLFIVYSIANYVLSILVAIVATLAIELPFVNMQQVFSGSNIKQKPVQNASNEEISKKIN